MPGSRSIARLLERNKDEVAKEFSSTAVLSHLHKKGVVSDEGWMDLDKLPLKVFPLAFTKLVILTWMGQYFMSQWV